MFLLPILLLQPQHDKHIEVSRWHSQTAGILELRTLHKWVLFSCQARQLHSHKDTKLPWYTAGLDPKNQIQLISWQPGWHSMFWLLSFLLYKVHPTLLERFTLYGKHHLSPAFTEEIICQQITKTLTTQTPSISALQVTQHLTQQVSKSCFDAGGGFEKAEEING